MSSLDSVIFLVVVEGSKEDSAVLNLLDTLDRRTGVDVVADDACDEVLVVGLAGVYIVPSKLCQLLPLFYTIFIVNSFYSPFFFPFYLFS